MADLLATGAAYLASARTTHAAQTVVYVRGSDEVSLSATPGRTIFRFADDYGMTQRVQSRDWLIRVADLVIDGSAVEPARGDKIKQTVGETVYTFEVMAPNGEPHWRYCDGHQVTYRIHSSQVAQGAA